MMLLNPYRFGPPPPNLLNNPGAETGDLTGWTSLVGAPAAVVSTVAGTLPRSGSYFFTGGAAVRSVQRQNVAVPLGNQTNVDANLGVCNVEYWSTNANTDFTSVTLQFVSAGGIVIGTWVGPYETNTGAYTKKTYAAKMPALTRSVNIDLNMYRQSGTPNDGNFDDLRLWFTSALNKYPLELPINNPSTLR